MKNSVWIGNGNWEQGGSGNRNVFTGTEEQCVDFISKLAEKHRKRGHQLHHHIWNGMMIREPYFYAFIDKPN